MEGNTPRKEIHHKSRPPIHAIKEMITLKLPTKRAILASELSMCSPHHPRPSNGTNLFPNPPGASSPHPLPRVHPCPRVWHECGWIHIHKLGVVHDLQPKKKRNQRSNHERVSRLGRIRFYWVGRSQAHVGVRLLVGGVHWWVKRWTHVIQSDIIIRLMEAKEQAHD